MLLVLQAGVPQRLVLALAIFKLYPLQFTGMLEVTRNVSIYFKNSQDGRVLLSLCTCISFYDYRYF